MAVREKLRAEDLLRMGDIGPCELVRGELVMMSPAGGRHGLTVARIFRLLADFAESHDLGLVIGFETGVLISREPDTVRAPDVMFYRKGRLSPEEVPEGYLEVPPDLVVEVVSPSDSWSDLEAKVEEYLNAGVKAVWVADPQRKTVTIFPERRTLHEGDTLEGGEVLPGFSCPVKSFFG